MNKATREFILSLLTPEKIKIYLIILIIAVIYAIYYRYSLKTPPTTVLVESFNNKNLKANRNKANSQENDTETMIESDKRSKTVSDNSSNDYISTLEKKLINDSADSPDSPDSPDSVEPFSNASSTKQNDALYYQEEIKKTYKELGNAEDAKLQYYNRAFNNYLDAQRRNNLNVNVADIGNSIEGGIIDIFQSIGNTVKSGGSGRNPPIASKANASANSVASNKPQQIRESFSNAEDDDNLGYTISSEDDENPDLIRKEKNYIRSLNASIRDNVYDNSNSGVLSASNSKKGNKGSVKEKGSENVFLYVFELISDFIANFDVSKITYYLRNYQDIIDILTREDNLIPAGVLMMIIAFSLFFIDITM